MEDHNWKQEKAEKRRKDVRERQGREERGETCLTMRLVGPGPEGEMIPELFEEADSGAGAAVPAAVADESSRT